MMLAYPIRIVLVEPSHPGNIGACARAMKNMGLSYLYLVKPKQFPHPQATALAAGAEDILMSVCVVNTLYEALCGCQCVWMTSGRQRHINIPQIPPEEAVNIYQTTCPGAPLAIVFGRERYGLTNQELLHGHYHVFIPTHSEYTALNLAQSVLIIAYVLRLHLKPPTVVVRSHLASYEMLEQFYDHLFLVLENIGFLSQRVQKKLKERLRRLFGRTRLENQEVHLLRGILSRVEYRLRCKKKEV